MLFRSPKCAAISAALLGSVSCLVPYSAASNTTVDGNIAMVGSAYIAVPPKHTGKINGNITLRGGGIIPLSLAGENVHADCADQDMALQFVTPDAHITASAGFSSDNNSAKKKLYEDITNATDYDFKSYIVPIVHKAVKIVDESGAPLTAETFATRVTAQPIVADDLPGAENDRILFHTIVDGGANNQLDDTNLVLEAIKFGASSLNEEDGTHYVKASLGCEYAEGETPQIIPIVIDANQKVHFQGNNRHYKHGGQITMGQNAELVAETPEAVPSASITLGESSHLTLADGTTLVAQQVIVCQPGSTVSVANNTEGAKGEATLASGSMIVL